MHAHAGRPVSLLESAVTSGMLQMTPKIKAVHVVGGAPDSPSLCQNITQFKPSSHVVHKCLHLLQPLTSPVSHLMSVSRILPPMHFVHHHLLQ